MPVLIAYIIYCWLLAPAAGTNPFVWFIKLIWERERFAHQRGLPTELYLTKKYVNDKRKIETKEWIGKTGQTEFKATIHFGKKALSKYAKGKDLTECIPDLESQAEWIEIDIEKRIIDLKLD